MVKRFLGVLCVFAFIVAAAAQDSSTNKVTSNLKVGLYLTKDEFFKKQPSVVVPFVMVPYYKTTAEKDSFIYSYKCIVKDTIINIEKVFGLFDGYKLYERVTRDDFSQLQGLGKHPYSNFIWDPKYISLGGPLPFMVSIVDALVSRPKEVVSFYNKKRKWVEASVVAMVLLLKDDKDLDKEFRSEKVKNTTTFIKYLGKMNERYPY